MKPLAVFLVFVSLCAELSAEEPVRIFAASSLTDALSEVIADYTNAQPSERVVAQFGASSDLARQILAGAPADIFLSADRRQLERVAAAGLITNDTDLLSNVLVIVRHRDIPGELSTPAELERLGRVAMADPEAVPAGVYAREYLESQGLWSRLRDKVVPTLDVRGALAAVASGNVETGIVYRTDAVIEDRVKVVYTVPKNVGPRIVYALAIVEPSGGKRGDVRALYDYVRSAPAGAVFERYGFVFLPASSDDAR